MLAMKADLRREASSAASRAWASSCAACLTSVMSRRSVATRDSLPLESRSGANLTATSSNLPSLVQPLRFEVLPARAGQDKGHILLLLFVAPGGEYQQILQSAANCLRRRVTQKALGRRVPARYDAG